MKKAWTYVYNAFIIGGNVHQAKGFEFDETKEELHYLGKEFNAYILDSPDGKTKIIVEEVSGGIVGNDYHDVCLDIAMGNKEEMQAQIEDACKEFVKIVSEEEFWKIYLKNLKGGK